MGEAVRLWIGLTADEWVAIGTIALAVATGLLAIFTFVLANDARKTAKLQQQAYLVAYPAIDITKPRPNSYLMTFTLVLRNAGLTPAMLQASQLVGAPGLSGDRVDFAFSPTATNPKAPVTFVVPPGEIERRGYVGFSNEQWNEIAEGKRQYVVGLDVHYRDIFGKVHRITRTYFLRFKFATWDETLAQAVSPQAAVELGHIYLQSLPEPFEYS